MSLLKHNSIMAVYNYIGVCHSQSAGMQHSSNIQLQGDVGTASIHQAATLSVKLVGMLSRNATAVEQLLTGLKPFISCQDGLITLAYAKVSSKWSANAGPDILLSEGSE